MAPGQFVHKDCRSTYCNKNVKVRDTRKKVSTTDTLNTLRRLRSHAEKFDFQEHCLICGHSTKVYGQKGGYDVWPVRTHNVHREILGICESRGDEWANTVRGGWNMLHMTSMQQMLCTTRHAMSISVLANTFQKRLINSVPTASNFEGDQLMIYYRKHFKTLCHI